jgi:hypothetical protein
MKKREMFVFVSLDSPHSSLEKEGGMRALSRIPPRSGSWVHPSLPPYRCRIARCQATTGVLPDSKPRWGLSF